MTVSEQVDALQAKVADLKSSLDASRHETNEQIKARVASAKAKADAAKETVHGKADQAADHAHTQWQSRPRETPSRQRTTRPTRWITQPGPSTRQKWRYSMPPMLAHGPMRERQRRHPAEHTPGTPPWHRAIPAGPP
jgi:hypothetical protein